MERLPLTENQEMVWISLTSLEDNVRITKSRLREHTGVGERGIYEDIRAMRRKEWLVGSSKQGNRGYYECRSYEDVLATVKEIETAAYDSLETARIMRAAGKKQFKINDDDEN